MANRVEVEVKFLVQNKGLLSRECPGFVAAISDAELEKLRNDIFQYLVRIVETKGDRLLLMWLTPGGNLYFSAHDPSVENRLRKQGYTRLTQSFIDKMESSAVLQGAVNPTSMLRQMYISVRIFGECNMFKFQIDPSCTLVDREIRSHIQEAGLSSLGLDTRR